MWQTDRQTDRVRELGLGQGPGMGTSSGDDSGSLGLPCTVGKPTIQLEPADQQWNVQDRYKMNICVIDIGNKIIGM